MTFKITVKYPELDIEIQDAMQDEGLAQAFMDRYVKWGEYLTLELSTDGKGEVTTCVLVETPND